ncbi:MAG: Na+/H+ antiporter NhaA [Candidatus Doudnabacteria bacterium]|nr:Na+/H+ antiporter NhaA [Candidatus Doudnabacteria bacterium]
MERQKGDASLSWRQKAWKVFDELSLVFGVLTALVWCFLNYESWSNLVNYEIFHGSKWFGHAHVDAEGAVHYSITVGYVVTGVLLSLTFFTDVGIELKEFVLDKVGKWGEVLSPFAGTAGGVIGPMLVYVSFCTIFVVWAEMNRGVIAVTATDIALALFLLKRFFGPGHAIIGFAMILAVADDGVGLAFIGIFLSKGEVGLWWMLSFAIALAVGIIGGRVFRIQHPLFYFVFSVVPCWLCFQVSGLEPALGAVIGAFAMPTGKEGGVFDAEELERSVKHDPGYDKAGNRFKAWVHAPKVVVLFAFGFVACGVPMTAASFNVATLIFSASLFIGKTFFIFGLTVAAHYGLSWLPEWKVFTWLRLHKIRARLAEGVTFRELFAGSIACSVGCTVALFMINATWSEGWMLDGARLGSVLSLPVGWFMLWLLQRLTGPFRRFETKEAWSAAVEALSDPVEVTPEPLAV